MKTISRQITEEKRQELKEMAYDLWDCGCAKSIISALRSTIIETMNEMGIRNDKPAYTASDSRYQSASNWQSNYKRTGNKY